MFESRQREIEFVATQKVYLVSSRRMMSVSRIPGRHEVAPDTPAPDELEVRRCLAASSRFRVPAGRMEPPTSSLRRLVSTAAVQFDAGVRRSRSTRRIADQPVRLHIPSGNSQRGRGAG